MSSKIRSVIDKITTKIHHLRADQSGNIAIIAAVSLMPMVLCVGAAVDYSRISLARSTMTSALDSATLAAAKGLSNGSLVDDQVEAYVNAMLAANLRETGIRGMAYTVSNIRNDSENGTLSADIHSDLPMSFMTIANIDTVKVASHVEVSYGNQKVELAMMLDVTGSMRGSKISALKAAAKDAVNILMPATVADPTKTRIGLVPYSYSVNAGSYADNVTDDLSYRCVTERSGGESFSDASPIAHPVGADSRAVDANYCPNQAIRPLTSKRRNLLRDINAYSASGYTAGHLGVAWSYYMLSPKWDAIWPTPSKARPYNDSKTLKIALLMTDGEFNTYYDGTTGTAWGGNVAPSNNAAARLCDDMRAKGIVIYSVAFSAPASAQALLRNCATPDSDDVQHYYNATSGAELKRAFANIAKSIQTLRVSK